MTTLLESANCTRCGGTGKFSFNMVDGSKCYGCNGRGVKLTKRGLAAQAWLNNRCSIEAKDVRHGMILWDIYMYRTVLNTMYMLPENSIEITFYGERCKRIDNLGYLFKQKPNAADKQAALDYQATLTKSGAVSKRKVRA